jgi:hypothetical protein
MTIYMHDSGESGHISDFRDGLVRRRSGEINKVI